MKWLENSDAMSREIRGRVDAQGSERRIKSLEDRLADAQTCAITADRKAARWAARVKALEARLEAVVSAARGTG